ncbi:3-hydroxyisobutyrate dehydrogenase [Rhizoclosmatium globosum]|uniref:3-hydroxyisobutyrate dehydrogenase n=1 Tax=Rhizoclosmatium globosum TaxID=329046 RepID=A0A1Y2ATI4_9FUNG|nr:3-hydroxyisobutyrate dehydrogenase [Rhizoclosmatium globosum]|eukprot:ORY25862.1 3-hydroxyisobutyrate dehydrogenase [Rhizoclosmatium globosum]
MLARRTCSFQPISIQPTIGFVGLGQMGFPMAANLMKKTGSPFVVFDAFPATASKFVENAKDLKAQNQSVSVAATPRDLAAQCDVIVTMLPAGPHVKSVYLDAETGLLAGIKGRNNVLLVDSSTIDVATSKHVAETVGNAGAVMLDAPVSGGTLGAEAGTLTFMVGSPSVTTFNTVKDTILVHMGKNIVHCGTVGNGQVAKICNNMMLGISMVAASETMNLGVRLGMDPKLLAGIINTSSGRCWSTDTYNPCPGVLPNVPASRDYTGGFGTSLMAKDLSLAVSAAHESKSTVTLGAVAHQIYNQVSSQKEFKNKDFSSVYKWLNDNQEKI